MSLHQITSRASLTNPADTFFMYSLDVTNLTATTTSYTNLTVDGNLTLSSLTPNTALTLNSSNVVTGQTLTNGEVLIGSTGSAPVPANITSSNGNIGITNGAGTITIVPSATPSYNSVALPGGSAIPLNIYIGQAAWTPQIQIGGTPITAYSTNVGIYSKIGRIVFLTGTIIPASVPVGATGGATLNNLPYPVFGAGQVGSIAVAGQIDQTGITAPNQATTAWLNVNGGNSMAVFMNLTTTAPGLTSYVQMTQNQFAAGSTQLYFSGWYVATT